MRKDFKNQRGSVLLFALLIISTMIGAVTLFSNLIISEIQQSRLLDYSLQAYYVAESGGEEALFRLRQLKAVKNCEEAGLGSCQPDGYCLASQIACVYPTGSLDSQGDWQISINNAESLTVDLAQNEMMEVGLFFPDAFSGFGIGIDSIYIEWEDGDLSNTVAPIIQATLIEIDYLWQTELQAVFEYLADSFSRVFNEPDTNRSYILRLKALYDSAKNLTIKVYEGQPPQDGFPPAGNQTYIAGQLIINSLGRFKDSQQIISIAMPVRSPLSGLYDYVLFSEQEIVK